jgi:hypothetical protein
MAPLYQRAGQLYLLGLAGQAALGLLQMLRWGGAFLQSSPKTAPARLLYIVNIYVYDYVYKSKSFLLQILAIFSLGSEIQIAI